MHIPISAFRFTQNKRTFNLKTKSFTNFHVCWHASGVYYVWKFLVMGFSLSSSSRLHKSTTPRTHILEMQYLLYSELLKVTINYKTIVVGTNNMNCIWSNVLIFLLQRGQICVISMEQIMLGKPIIYRWRMHLKLLHLVL